MLLTTQKESEREEAGIIREEKKERDGEFRGRGLVEASPLSALDDALAPFLLVLHFQAWSPLKRRAE